MRDPLRVPFALVRASLMTAMQYRSNFLLQGFTGLLETTGRTVPLVLVFSHKDTVAGWTFPECILVLGLYMLMHAVHAGVMEPNLGAVVDAIRKGTLDLVLMKPADAQLLVSLNRVEPSKVWDLVAALALCGWALARLGWPAPEDALVAGVMVLSGLCAQYGLWILAICTSFFFVRVDNLRFLLMSVTDAGRWPVTVFARPVRWLLTAGVPVAILTTFPALAIRGDWDVGLVVTGVGVAIGFLLVSRLAWTRSLGAYTSASS